MASRQKINKAAEKTVSNVSNGVGKQSGKAERPTVTDVAKSAGQDKSAGQEKSVDGATGAQDNSPMKQCVNVIEKKLRNLVKRKGKLDDYKKILKSGGTLNADQKEAIDSYEVLEQNMEFIKDLQKQFLAMNTEYEKQAKKQARRETIERHRAECARVKEVMRLLHFLDCLGSDELRTSLCDNKNIGITAENLDQFDEFYKLLSVAEGEDLSIDDQLTTVSSHLVSYLDAQDKPIVSTTYKNLRELVDRASGHLTSATTRTATESDAVNGHDNHSEVTDGHKTTVVDVGGVEANVGPVVDEYQEAIQPAGVEISNNSLPHIDSNSLHSVINETASQNYPFGMKYRPTEVRGYSFLSNDDVNDPAMQVPLVNQGAPPHATPQILPSANPPHGNPVSHPHQPQNPHT